MTDASLWLTEIDTKNNTKFDEAPDNIEIKAVNPRFC